MFLVSRSPCFICQGGDFSGSVVSLVEGDCDERAGVWFCIPVVDELGGEGGHAFLGLEAGMEEPEAGYVLGGRGFGETVDEGFEAGDDEFGA